MVMFGLGVAFSARAWAEGGGVAQVGGDPSQALGGLLLAFVILLACSGIVSGSETAIFSLDRLDVVQFRKNPRRGDRALLYLLDRPNGTLIAILILNNLANVALSLVAGAMADVYFTGLPAVGIAVAGLGVTASILVFGEVVPKCVSQATAPRIAPIAAWPTAAFAQLIWPIRLLLNAWIGLVFRLLKVPPMTTDDLVSEEELKVMMNVSRVSGLLEEDERDMIRGVFELDETFAEEIMIPRSEVVGYPKTTPHEEMVENIRKSSHSRILVFGDTPEHVEGFVLAKEVLLHPDRDWTESIRQIMCVAPRIRLDDLLTQFRRNAAKIAAVVDEYGQFSAIVTLHDLLEEIVGDMAERHETIVQEFLALSDGHYRVQGRSKLADLGRELGVDFPSDMGATVGGFVMNMLGHVPSEGVRLQHEGLDFEVARMIGRRILQLEVRRMDLPEGQDGIENQAPSKSEEAQ